MKFLKQIQTRKQFEELLNEADLLYSETRRCLYPINKIFWGFYYKTQTVVDNKSLEEIEISITILINYIDQICRLENKIAELYANNKQLLSKYDTTYSETMHNLKYIQESVKYLEQNFNDIPDHADYNEIKIILSSLEKVNRKLYLINKYRPQDILNNEQ